MRTYLVHSRYTVQTPGGEYPTVFTGRSRLKWLAKQLANRAARKWASEAPASRRLTHTEDTVQVIFS